MTANDGVSEFVASTLITVLSHDTVYVNSAIGDDDFSGATARNPFRTIKKALTVVWQESAATFHLAERICTEHGLKLSGPITVVGDGVKSNVIVQAATSLPAVTTAAESSTLVFDISHSAAVLRNVTVRYGTAASTVHGGNIRISASLMEDCIISGRRTAKNKNAYGSNIAISGTGHVNRCRIENGAPVSYSSTSTGYGSYSQVYLLNGVLENSLICNARAGGSSKVAAAAVSITGGTMINCTVVNNSAVASSGAKGIVCSGSGKVVDCAIYGNGGTATTEWGNANAGCFINCATSADAAFTGSTANVGTVTAASFIDYANGDYNPAKGSDLALTGTLWADYFTYGATSLTDLAGKSRKSGNRVDIGCYSVKCKPMAVMIF